MLQQNVEAKFYFNVPESNQTKGCLLFCSRNIQILTPETATR